MASLLGAIPSTTHAAFLKALSDAVFQGNVVGKMLYDKGIKYEGGFEIREPLIIAQTNGGAYSTTDTLVAPDGEEVDSARYQWKQFYASTGLDGLKKAMNSGLAQAIDYWEAKMETMKLTLGDKLAASMLLTSGSGATTDLTLIEEIVGAGTKEVGTLTTTEVPLWAGQVNNAAGALTYLLALDAYMDCSEGNIHPGLIAVSKAGYTDYCRLGQVNQRLVGKDNTIGFENIMFHDAIVVADSHIADSGGDAFTGKRAFYLNFDFLRLSIHTDNNFRLKEVEPDFQDMRLAFLFIYLNLTCNNRRFQGVLHNFTSPA